MRKALFGVVVLAAILIAVPAEACKDCAYTFLWPWLEECAECIDIGCGYILCHIEQYGPSGNDEHCVLEGDDCNITGRDCPPPSPELEANPLEEWQLTRVQVTTAAPPKAAG